MTDPRHGLTFVSNVCPTHRFHPCGIHTPILCACTSLGADAPSPIPGASLSRKRISSRPAGRSYQRVRRCGKGRTDGRQRIPRFVDAVTATYLPVAPPYLTCSERQVKCRQNDQALQMGFARSRRPFPAAKLRASVETGKLTSSDAEVRSLYYISVCAGHVRCGSSLVA